MLDTLLAIKRVLQSFNHGWTERFESMGDDSSMVGGVAGQTPMRAGLDDNDNAPTIKQPDTLYFSELCKAMGSLARQPRAVFMGQSVAYPGTAMYNTLREVPDRQRVEWPVAEDMQLGAAIGASLNGDLPICIYPRINFLLLAISQLVLHLDKLPLYSGYSPKVIIRTAIATDKPLDPGVQHLGDFSYALRDMLQTVVVVNLDSARDIVPQYRKAVSRLGSTLLIENLAQYG